MKKIQFDRVPEDLRVRPQWIVWKTIIRDGKEAKVPLQLSGEPAKSNDPTTWTTFETIRGGFDPDKFSGIGFVFTADDPFVGIDLDGCRGSDTGIVAGWAREVILKFGTYAEVSPSGTGIKLFAFGASPFPTGRKVAIEEPPVADKQPAVEVYDKLRYFAVTGWVLEGMRTVREAGENVGWLAAKYLPDEPAPTPSFDFRSAEAVIERARKYLTKLPPAVSGKGGHNQTFHAACVLVLGFELDENVALALLMEWNRFCDPPWTEKELRHKVTDAGKQPGVRGYLRDVKPDNWSRVSVPTYRHPKPPPPEPKTATLAGSAAAYLDDKLRGDVRHVGLSIAELDHALGGGVEAGEMVIVAARPSHGKSALALQCVHHWTEVGRPAAIVSEEMTAKLLGKRTLLYASSVPESDWITSIATVRDDLATYRDSRAEAYVLEGCRNVEVAAEAIERLVDRAGVQCAVVDYIQLLRGEGRTKYEQVSNASVILRQLATRCHIVLLVVAQLNRDIESRTPFVPCLSDLRDSGQLEQDADVILFQVHCCKVDRDDPPNRMQFFIAKNRNRETNRAAFEVYFQPERMMFLGLGPGGVGDFSAGFAPPKSDGTR